jgi:mRNA interferase MazF
MNPQPGEIWLADLGLAAKTRPVVIVSGRDPEPPRSLVLYVPLTTQRETALTKYRCLGFRSLTVNQ